MFEFISWIILPLLLIFSAVFCIDYYMTKLDEIESNDEENHKKDNL